MKRTGFRKKTFSEALNSPRMKKSPLSRKSSTKRIKRSTKANGGQKSISKHRKELWKIFSLYIRTRDKYICCTCGKHATGGGMHAAHFITGATCTAKLYFDETNVHAGCYHCNINLSGNWVRYEEFMVGKYGIEYINALKLRRTHEMGHKVTEEWYEQQKEIYTKKLAELETA